MTVPVNGWSSRTRTDNWEGALVTGNGRQGALLYGGPDRALLTVSHERLFLPVAEPLDPPHTAPLLAGIRSLLGAGRYRDAAELVCRTAAAAEPGYADTRPIDPFVGAATLTCTPAAAGDIRDWRRATDFGTGVVTQRWRTGDGPVGVSAFVSRVHDVVVLRLSGPAGWTLRLAPVDGRPPVPVLTRVDDSRGGATLTVTFPETADPAPDGYSAPTGYTVTYRWSGPDVVLLRTVPHLGTASDGDPDRPWPDVSASWTDLLRAHTAAHRDLYHRVRLDLGDTAGTASAGTAAAGTAAADPADLLARDPTPGLVRRLFDAGRYAIVSSTGERPPVLQGVWSGTYEPAWGSGWTLDGNLAAAVAALHPTGCPELMLPLFDLVEERLPDLRRNARRLYGLPGVLTPVHMSTHGRQNHFGPVWCQTFWTAGAAWLARMYYDHWCFTGDRKFLAGRALPFMCEAARFQLAFARRGGGPVFTPSYSPENAPANTGSQATVDATMDVAVVRDLMRNLLAATAALGRTDPAADEWRALLAALPPYRIGPDGELAEWVAPDLADNHAHRHASHLYPLWYEPDPAVVDDAAMRAAAAGALRRRLEFWRGDRSGEMGYGLAQLGLAAAALGDGERAWETLTLMATRYWQPNLVSTHDRGAIFNVDLCGGLPAVVAAMLVGSTQAGPDTPGCLRLLPALPTAWPRGSVRGLAARNAVTVRCLAWDGDGYEAVLESLRHQRLPVTVAGADAGLVELPAGRPVRLAGTLRPLRSRVTP